MNENDPVGLDETIESQTLISKVPVYNVAQHATYDDTVQEDHAMDPVPVMKAFQRWEEAPEDPSVLEQLFISEGADPASQVQFLSLSAGALGGGSAPGNNLTAPAPAQGPKLVIEPSNLVRDIGITRGTAKSYTRRFKNTGSGEISIYLNNLSNGFQSEDNRIYEEGLDTVTNAITAQGDKLTDWSWSIAGSNGTSNYRQVGTETASFLLSSSEYVDVVYTSQNTSWNADYQVNHTYEAHFPAPIGIQYNKIVFDITF